LPVEERLPASASRETLRLALREALARGDCVSARTIRASTISSPGGSAQPVPPADDRRNSNSVHLEALRARALVLTLYCSGLRRTEMATLEIGEVLGGPEPGEADVRGNGDRERTVFLDPATLEVIRAYVNARGVADTSARLRSRSTPRRHAGSCRARSRSRR
jgi:integrase